MAHDPEFSDTSSECARDEKPLTEMTGQEKRALAQRLREQAAALPVPPTTEADAEMIAARALGATFH